MTENETIELLKDMQSPPEDYAELVGAPAFSYGHKYVYPYPQDYAIEEAISALKEVQQYREIGTVEECRADREKQSPKNIEKIREGEYCCPKCYTVYDDCIFEYDYCINCGQAIRWNENLEGMEDE